MNFKWEMVITWNFLRWCYFVLSAVGLALSVALALNGVSPVLTGILGGIAGFWLSRFMIITQRLKRK